MLLLGVFPATVLNAFADETATYTPYGFTGGTGDRLDPYILSTGADFKGLADNVANIDLYSQGKYFRVQDFSAEENPSIYIDGDYCIGGLENDANRYFLGSLDLNGYEISLTAPLFGTLGEGAEVYNGKLVISSVSDKNQYEDQANQAWGALARRIVASDNKTGTVSIRDITVSVNAEWAEMGEDSKENTSSFGGIVGTINNSGSEKLDVRLKNVSVKPEGDANFKMYASADYVGGLVGSLEGKANTADSSILLIMDNVTMNGSIRNNMTSGVLGGIIGAATEGCEVRFETAATLPDPDGLIGDYKALIIGAANQSLVYTYGITSMTVNGKSYGLGELTTVGKETHIIDLANAGSVYGDLELGSTVSGEGTQASPYIISTSNDMLLLAAAINTNHPKVLQCFAVDSRDGIEDRAYLYKAHYEVINNLNLADRGFTGIGYYVEEGNYQDFCGTIIGDAEFPPTISLGIRTNQSHAGFIPVLGDGGHIEGLAFSGKIETSNSYAGAVAGAVGLPDGSTKAVNVTLKDIHSSVEISGTTSGIAGFGGLVGHANYSQTKEKSSINFLNNTFDGTITAAGTYVGGMIGRIDTPSQKDKNTVKLELNVDNYIFDGTLNGTNKNGSYFGGFVGSIIASDSFTDRVNEGYIPGVGFGIQYNTVAMNVTDVRVNGSINCAATGVGGFAGTMSGVDAAFANVVVGGTHKVENGFGGLAQMVAGRYTINGFGISSDADWTIGMATPDPSGILFGNSANAWVDVAKLYKIPAGANIRSNKDGNYFATQFADLSAYTFYISEDAYAGTETLVGGMVNVKDFQMSVTVNHIYKTYDQTTGKTVTDGSVTDQPVFLNIGKSYTATTKPVYNDITYVLETHTDELTIAAVTKDHVINIVYLHTIASEGEAGDSDAGANEGGNGSAEDSAMDENHEVVPYTPSTFNHAEQSRIYNKFTAETIYGKGTEAEPFIINSAATLQTLSVFQYLAPNISWMLLGSFPDAAYGEGWNDIKKVMYLRNAHYKFEGNLDLSELDYYPMPVIGGSYVGSGAVVTFAADAKSSDKLSSTRENHGGLFTAIMPASDVNPIVISGFELKGNVAGTWYPAALVSGMLTSNGEGVSAINGGFVEISDIILDDVHVTTDSNTTGNGTGLLVGDIQQGSHDIHDISIKYNGGAKLADALIGRASGENLLLEMERIEFPKIESEAEEYFNVATFIGKFESGIGHYFYNSREDEDIYAYGVDSKYLYKQGNGNDSPSQVIINPNTFALDRGYGTAQSPFIIDSPAQLYALGTVFTNLDNLGGVLKSVNGQELTNKSAVREYLSKAHYRIIDDLDFGQVHLSETNTIALADVGLGSLAVPFSGTIDGRGHRIVLSSGTSNTPPSSFGLFRYIKGANIQNLHISTDYRKSTGELQAGILSVTAPTGESYNGMVAAVALGGDNMLDNIKVSGTVNITSGNNSELYAGGYVGRVEAGTLQLINMPDNYARELNFTVNGAAVAADNDHFAVITPVAQDGFVIYRGDDPYTSVVLPEENVILGKVNETLSKQIGVMYGDAKKTYTYSLVTADEEFDSDGDHTNFDVLPGDIGITLTPEGLLSGVPKYGGVYSFTVRVEATNSDGEKVYELKTYTLKIEKAVYPNLIVSTELQNLTYTSTPSVAVENFPCPSCAVPSPCTCPCHIEGSEKGEYPKAHSDAELEYDIQDGKDVITVTTDEKGNKKLKIIGVGHVKLVISKPEDSAYYMTSTTIEFDVRPADVWVTMDEITYYYGSNNTPENFGAIYIDGLKELEDLETEGPYEYKKGSPAYDAWEDLGLGELSYDKGTLNTTDFGANAIGDYILTINKDNESTAAVADKYNIHYRNGVVHIERKKVTVDDYAVIVGENQVVDHFNGAWYKSAITVKPAGDYELISKDAGETWTNATTGLNFSGDQDQVVNIWLKDTDTGVVTDAYPLQVRIDNIAPTAAIEYITTSSADGPIFNSGYAENGMALFKDMKIRMSGTDPLSNGSASGILRVEYQFLKPGETLNDNGTWTPLTGNVHLFDDLSDMQGAYYVRAVDQAGNVSQPVHWVGYDDAPWFVLDRNAPVVNISNSADYGSWFTYKDGIPPLSFTVSDAGSGMAETTWTLKQGETVVASGGFGAEEGEHSIPLNELISQQGDYTLTISVEDVIGRKTGDVRHKAETVVNIRYDNTPPQVTVNNGWTADEYTTSKEFTITVNDGGLSPVKNVWVKVKSVKNGDTVTEVNGKAEALTENGNGTYVFTASTEGDEVTYTVIVEKESCGKNSQIPLTTEEVVVVPKIDRKTPILTVESQANYVGDWTKGPIEYTFTASGGYKGTGTVYASFNGGDKIVVATNIVNGGTASWSASAPANDVINGTYRFWLESEAELKSNSVEHTAKIDQKAPEVVTLKVHNPGQSQILNLLTGGLFFKVTQVTAEISEPHSGLESSKMQLVHDGSGAVEEFIGKISNPNGNGTYTVTYNVESIQNFKGKIKVISVDKVGNSETKEISETVIWDGDVPEFTLTLDANTVNLLDADLWTTQKVTATLSGILDGGNAPSGIDKIVWWLSATEVTGDNWSLPEKVNTVNDAENLTSYSFDVTENGEYYLAVAVFDKAGNRSVQCAQIRKDSNKAVISELFTNDSNKLVEVENNVYHVETNIRTGETINIRINKEVPHSTLWLKVEYNSVVSWIPVTSNYNGNECMVSFTLPTENLEGDYIFTVYHGNYSNASTGGTAADYASIPVTLVIENGKVDADTPKTPVITNVNEFDKWYIDLTEQVDVQYETTAGSTEWLEYAVLSGTVDPSAFEYAQFATLTEQSEWSANSTANGSFAFDAEWPNGAQTIAFRVRDGAGNVGGIATVTVKKDNVTPFVNIAATAGENAYESGSWTNQDVVLKVTNTAGNESPCTISVTIGGIDYDLSADTEITYEQDGKTLSGKWNAVDNTLTLSGNCNENTEVAFTITSAAGISGEEESYNVSLKQDKDDIPELTIADLAPDVWTDAWYVAYPTIQLKNDNGKFNGYYLCWNVNANNTADSGKQIIDGAETFYTLSADGEYTFSVWLEDKAGNQGNHVDFTVKADCTAPAELTTSKVSSDATNTVLAVNAVDLSGVKSYKYYCGTELDEGSDQWIDCTDGNKMTIPTNYTGKIYVRAEDNAGNVARLETDSLMYETYAPTVSGKIVTALMDGALWYSTNPEISISVVENDLNWYSGIATVLVEELSGGQVVSQSFEVTDEHSLNFGTTYTTQTQGTFRVQITATDRAGNSASVLLPEVKVDTTTPGGLLVEMKTSDGKEYDGNNDTWTNKSVNITLSAPNYEAVSSYAYSLDGGTTWIKLDGNRLTLRDDMNKQILFKVTTLSGREVIFGDDEETEYWVRIQSSMPRNLFAFMDNGVSIFYLNANGSDRTPDSGWYSNLTLSFRAPYRTEPDTAPVTTYYTITREGENGQETVYENVAVVGAAGVGVQTIPTLGDGIYTVTFWAQDKAGNRTVDYVTEYQVDGTAPTNVQLLVNNEDISLADDDKRTPIQQFLQSLTFGLFYGKYITLTVKADFNVSGVQSIEYMRVPVNSAAQLDKLRNMTNFSNVNWEEFGEQSDWIRVNNSNGVFYDTSDFVGLYFLRLTDRAGNVTTVASNGVVVDLTDPKAFELKVYGSKIVPTKADISGNNPNWYIENDFAKNFNAITDYSEWYRSARVDYTVQDTVSGIDRIEIYHHYADENLDSKKVQVISGETVGLDAEVTGQLHTKEYKGSYITKESGIYKVEVRVIDKVGHTRSSETPGMLQIENRIPQLIVEKSNYAHEGDAAVENEGKNLWQGKWTNKDVTFTLSVVGVTAPVTYWYSIDNGSTWKQIHANGAKEYIVSITEDTNATYTFKALVGASFNADGSLVENSAIYEIYEGIYAEGMKRTDYEVLVQKTKPAEFTDANVELYYQNGNEQAKPSDDGWYNKALTLKITLPQPKKANHAPMRTEWVLTNTTENKTTSGVWTAGEWSSPATAEISLAADGVYTLELITYDKTIENDGKEGDNSGNSNEKHVWTIKLDTSAPTLVDIQVDKKSIKPTTALEKLTFGLFFKHVTVTADVNYNISDRKDLWYYLAEQTTGVDIPVVPENAEWIRISNDQSSFTFEKDFRGIVYVKAKDLADNESKAWMTYGLVADATAPTLMLKAEAPGAVHNAAAGWTVNADVSDDNSIVTTNWLNADATLTVTASDIVSEMNTLAKVSYEIKATNTTGGLSYKVGNEKVGNEVKSDPSGVLYDEKYSTDKAPLEGAGPGAMNPMTLTFTNDGVYTVTVTAEDQSGNETVRKICIMVDKSIPTDGTLSINGSDSLVSNDTNAPVYMKAYGNGVVYNAVQISYKADISQTADNKAAYQIVEAGGTYDNGKWTSETGVVYIDNGFWTSAEGNNALLADLGTNWVNKKFVIFIRVTDNAGNVYIFHTGTIHMDTVNPEVTVEGNPDTWIADSVDMTITVKDPTAGVDSKAVTVTRGNQPYKVTYNQDGTWKFTADVNGQYVVTVVDRADNKTVVEDSSVNVTKIDKLPPTAANITNAGDYVAEKWYNGDQTINVTFNKTLGTNNTIVDDAQDYAGAKERLEYQLLALANGSAVPGTEEWKDVAWQPVNDGESDWNKVSWENVASKENSLKVSAAADHDQKNVYVRFRVVDELGRAYVIEKPIVINFDTTAPTNITVTGTEVNNGNSRDLLEKVTGGLFFKERLKLTISYNANISGEKSVEYVLSEHKEVNIDEALKLTTWKGYTDNSYIENINDGGYRGVIYVRVTDKAGNSTTIGTNLVIVDGVKPEHPTPAVTLENTDTTYNSGDWINSNVVFTLSGGNNTKAGLDHYEYLVSDNANDLAEAKLNSAEWKSVNAASDVQLVQTADGKVVKMVVDGENTAVRYFRFRAVSKSGMYSKPTDIYTVKIDKTKPTAATVTIKDSKEEEVKPDPNTWYKDQTLSVSFKQDTGAPIHARYSIDNGISWTQVKNNGKDTEFEIALENGVHVVKVQVWDEAGIGAWDEAGIGEAEGNVTTQEYTVLVDDGNPTLTVVPKVGDTGETEYNGEFFTNQQVTLHIDVKSLAPFMNIEILKGTKTVATLKADGSIECSEGSATLTINKSEVGNWVVTATYALPKVDTDGTVYTVKANTTNVVGGSIPYGTAEVKNITYRYDATAPSFTVDNISYLDGGNAFNRVFSGLTFGLFFNKKVTVSVQISTKNSATRTNGSNLSKFFYKLGNEKEVEAKQLTGENGIWIAQFDIAPDFRGTVTMRAEDSIVYGANNQSSNVSIDKTVVVDDDAPTVTISTNKQPNDAHWYKEDVTVTVGAADSYAGLHD
ncbi:MAG: hypothetical protein IKT47_06770, partial [Oscillospiraceae bacterium]|nr:hypothetical protein [Oscillospiraceae bacterium]